MTPTRSRRVVGVSAIIGEYYGTKAWGGFAFGRSVPDYTRIKRNAE
jgi:hypothetical protein